MYRSKWYGCNTNVSKRFHEQRHLEDVIVSSGKRILGIPCKNGKWKRRDL
jgi:hypothetical protein